MADENFDFNLLDGGNEPQESDAGASSQELNDSSAEGVVDEASRNDSRSQPQSSPVVSNEEYTPRERALLDRIEQLTSQNYQGQRSNQQTDSAFEAQTHNFLDGMDIDEVLSSSENLNKLLLSVYNRGLQESIRMARDNWNTFGPDEVRGHIEQHMTMRELVDKFYADNPDLINARKTVGAIANEVSQENTELTIEQVFTEAAKRTRETLGLPALPSTSQNVEKPNLPQRRQPGNRRNGTAALTGIAKEIDDLIS